eukprot:3460875-Pyramimonas_sp.AAC.1
MAPPLPVVGCSMLACASTGEVRSPLGASAPAWLSELPAGSTPLTPTVSVAGAAGAGSSALPRLGPAA